MSAAGRSKRLELQFKHIKDLVHEQNRMVLAEVEPTNSEREDMLALLTDIKANVERGDRSSVLRLIEQYDAILNDLAELGYNIDSMTLEVPPETPRPAANKQDTPRKQVHFEKTEDSGISGPLLTSSGQPSTPNTEQDLPSTQIYDQNGLLLEDQDRRLWEIGNSVGRQREMGESINSELGLHNNLLEDVEAQVDHSQSRLDKLTNGVKTFNRKSRECGTCSIILVLLLVLLILIIL